MIEQMKKVSVLALDSKRQQVVSQMQDAGVIHLEVEPRESEDLAQLRETRAYVERATMVLPRQRPEGVEAEPEEFSYDGALSTAKYLNEVAERRRELEDRLDQLLREELRLEPWGDFDPADLEELRRWDVDIQLYTVTQKQFKSVSAPRLFEVNRSNGQVYFAVAYLEGEERLELTPMSLPDRRLAEIRSDIEEKHATLEELGQRIADRFPERENLQRAIRAIDDQIRFEEVKVGMDTDESLAYITGFVPQEFEQLVRDTASSGGWGLLIREPEPDEQVPTRVKNRKAVSIIEPVFDLMDTIPGYREVDISFWFLIFFTVFFAMIIGDGGYGLLITGASIFAVVRGMRREGSPSKGAVLLTVMGIATVGWGAITGTWFGYEPFAQTPFLASLKIEAISSFNPQSPETIQWVCFVLATTHLSIAHLWKFVVGLRRGRPKIKAIADLGWLLMMPGLYYLVLTVVLGRQLQDWSVYVILAGIVVVLMFSEQREGAGFLKGVGYGLANIFPTALDSISAFSDLISYIRLFAVGLATVEIAKSFNGMAAGMAADGALGIVAAVLILFLGHTLNLIMGALSVVVHGVRLNMLEFSRHLGMEWSGIPYRPFRKQEQTT
jgi:V/A-type H+-transporting ATPase subunit I